MAKRTPLRVGFIALVTLGSGVVNLYSVIGPSLPGRMHILRGLFPLEFAHLARFLTLLIGFALVVSSLNVYRRKRRAYYLVLTLSIMSVAFHVTKGLDYEEASVSALLVVLLVASRHLFTVRSSIPDFATSFIRLGLAFAATVGYSVAGFWFLDVRHFGINFHIGQSIHETMLFLSFVGDPTLVPYTRYARWFLDSLTLISVCGIGYALFALFRPVRYRLQTLPRERAEAEKILGEYGRHALDYFKIWSDKSFFFSQDGTAFLAYRVGANFAVVLGDPVGPEEAIESIIADFARLCDENDWGVAFHQTLPDFLPIYERQGFRRLKLGDDAVVDLKTFSISGPRMKVVRNTMNKFEKGGFQLRVFEPPVPDDVIKDAESVSNDWLHIPGHRERTFTLGLFEPTYLKGTPFFAVYDPSGNMIAFVNIIRSYKKGEVTLDLMRRRDSAAPGVMDFLFIRIFNHYRDLGYVEFNLGMAPMAGFQENENASREERAIHFFVQQLDFLFSFRGLKQYKAKFATSWEPRYIVYQSPLDLARHVMAINAVSEL